MKISKLTGKVSRALIVRRNVLGCLSRDGGARGELRCFMSREREGSWRDRGEGTGDGGRRREGVRGRRARGGKRGPGL
jgi:hypothetical protein